jgi:transcriptional regulator with XRE-family HTH domain
MERSVNEVNVRTLADLRRERLLTIRSLAELSGCAPRTVLQIEHGRRTPQPGTIKRLASALQVEPNAVREFRRAMGLPIDEAITYD